MSELLVSRIADLDLLTALLFLAATEEVIERFAKSVSLILKNLRVHHLVSTFTPLDLRYLLVEIEASEALAALFVSFFELRSKQVIDFGAKMELREQSCFLFLCWIETKLEASQHTAEIDKVVRCLSRRDD